MGNECSNHVDRTDNNLRRLNDDLDGAIEELEKMQVVLYGSAQVIQKEVFKNEHMDDVFDFPNIEYMDDTEKAAVKENFTRLLKQNEKLVKKVTGCIKGVEGMGTIAKYAWDSQTVNIDVKELGFETTSCTDSKRLPYHLKRGSLKIENMTAKWHGMGNIELKVRIKNTTNKRIRVVIGSGDVFEGPMNEQSAMSSETKAISIDAYCSKTERFICCCMNEHLAGPSGAAFRPTLLNLGIASDIIDRYEAKIKNIYDAMETNKYKHRMQEELWRRIQKNCERIQSVYNCGS